MTLVMACVFAGIWVRGMRTVDFLEFPIGNSRWQEWAFSDGIIRCWTIEAGTVPNEKMPKAFRWRKNDVMAAMFVNGDEPMWRWRENRFRVDESPPRYWQRPCDLFIPVWQIVVVLTLISALSLVSRPKAGKPELIQEP